MNSRHAHSSYWVCVVDAPTWLSSHMRLILSISDCLYVNTKLTVNFLTYCRILISGCKDSSCRYRLCLDKFNPHAVSVRVYGSMMLMQDIVIEHTTGIYTNLGHYVPTKATISL
jgi:hypothetical protein